MFNILRKWFIKDFDNIADVQVRTRYGILCGFVGIITNSLLSVLKILAGIMASSIAILADGINNLSDSASSVVTLIAFRIARSPADPEHPFGHQRIEYVSGLIVSFGILIVGVFLAQSSIRKIISPEAIDTSRFYLLLSILMGSILVKWWQSKFYKRAGNIIHSKALIATSVDSLSDVLTTTIVLISLVLAKVATINIDGAMGLLVSLFIIYNGLKLIKETISPLLGEAPSQEFVQKIKNRIKSYQGVLGIHDLVIHSYGPAKIFITVHVEVDANNDIIKSHELIDRIEMDFLKDYNFNLVIHMDPINMGDEVMLKLKDQVSDLINKIDDKLDFHDFRVIKEKKSTIILLDLVVPNQYHKTEKEIITLITEEIMKLDKTYSVNIVVDHYYLG